MNKEIYPVHYVPGTYVFTFDSEGIHGKIRKIVTIDRMEGPFVGLIQGDYYNLAFGDVKVENGFWEIDDGARTNNGDMLKVIATVAQIAIDFLCKNREAVLYFKGYPDSKSIKSARNQRNMLYQRAIDSNWEFLSGKFVIKGFNRKGYVDYVRGQPFDAILISCKK
ncbi:MAG TPA: hypothetical protein VN038_28155 [Dyadobacter sp.]|nr:hypothetical protein [Dyadobacter sp.]